VWINYQREWLREFDIELEFVQNAIHNRKYVAKRAEGSLAVQKIK
jgi:hypothetical protein